MRVSRFTRGALCNQR